ncbi:MAG TPA: glycosyltransferase [Kribbellaceae bacterium]|nr:glycosyltransferase [Kribbellaceae bacterium]
MGRSSRADVGIISSGHDVADARLHKITAALQRRGLSVEVWGLGDPAAGPAGADVRTKCRAGMLGRLGQAAIVPWRSRTAVLLTVDPDMVPVGRLVGTLRRRKMVADIHEDYARLLSDRPWARGLIGYPARVMVRMSSRLAAGADLTVVADTHLAPQDARHRRLVVQNLPDPEFLSPSAPEGPPRAVYVGDLRTSRGLFDMIEAIAAAPEWSLDLVGPVAGANRETLELRVEEPDVASRVRLYGRRPPKESWRIVRGAWVGLALLQPTPAFLEAMPSKVYEYLASGLPVLSTPLPRQVEIIRRSGGGSLASTPAEAAEILRHWSANPAELAKIRRSALEWATVALPARTPYDELADAICDLLPVTS